MDGIIIESQAVAPAFKNGFVVACGRTHEAVVIDPGDEVDGLLDFASRGALAIRYILLTHAHIDHLTGVPAAKRALGVPICLHRDDLFLYERGLEQAAMYGFHLDPLPPVDHFYTKEERIRFGDQEIRVHHTPGHCPGGVCLQAGDDLFVGDTLFAGSIGRTDFPGGDLATLIASIRNVLFAFGDHARVHPGHGPSTTIGHERRTNPFL
jgi:glyoxylase-like metal-dependent hydrolase (beta-lactamase superfamily II)